MSTINLFLSDTEQILSVPVNDGKETVQAAFFDLLLGPESHNKYSQGLRLLHKGRLLNGLKDQT